MEPVPAVRLDAVAKRFGATRAVDGVSLKVAEGELVALLGPSGCGKTTLLRLVAGFETPDAGRVWLQGRDATRTPPRQRPTATVFQSYALFPTMTVGENVAYGLRVRKTPKDERARRVAEALARVDLRGLDGRKVTALSGGQQQRVALARALAVEPAVLLYDEPLSNLDQALRESTRAELKALHERIGGAALYVTHDQQEALALADRIAVMRAGRIEQVGSPEALYEAPETAFVARFLGGSNVIEDDALATHLAGEPPPSGHALAVRADAFALVEADTPGAVPVALGARQYLGTHAEWSAEAGGVPLRIRTAPSAAAPQPPALQATRWRWVRAD